MHRYHPLLLLALLAGVVLAVFLPVCGYEFLSYDDGFNVYNNWRVTRFSAANLAYFWQVPYENLYVPLTYNLWAVLAWIAQMLPLGDGKLLNPHIFHAANLVLHLGCAMLVFAIVRLLVESQWAAWAGALVFAVHPVQVEAVAWVTGLKDVFSAFWSLMAIWQYVLYVKSGRTGSWAVAHCFLVGLCFLLAMLAKPGAVTVPLLLVVIGRLCLGIKWRRLALEILPMAVLALPMVIVTKAVQPDTQQAWQPAFWQRLLVSGDALSFYLYKVFLPLALGPDYGRTPRFVLEHDWVYMTPLLLVAVGFILWRTAQERRLTAASIFVASLLPVLGLVSFSFQNISTVADRYLYLAMLGPALVIGWALTRWRTKWAWLIFAVAAAGLAGKAIAQLGHWQNSTTFTRHALAVNPKSWVMHNNQGIDLTKAGSHEEAIAAFEKALAHKPDYAEAYNNLGVLYRGLSQNTDAIENFKKSLAVNPDNAKSAFNLAMLYSARKKPLQAIENYRQAIQAKPDFIEAYNNLGLLYLELNRSEEALALYAQAIELAPDLALLYYNLARAYAELGKRQESIAMLSTATEVDPEFGQAYHQLCRAYFELGDYPAARANAVRAKLLGITEDGCGSLLKRAGLVQ